MKTLKILCYITIIFLLTFKTSLYSQNKQKYSFKSLPVDIFKPYTWNYTAYNLFKTKKAIKDTTNLHPLHISRIAFSTLLNGYKNNDSSLLNLGKEYMDFMLYDYPIRKKNNDIYIYPYPFKHGKFAPGWWSGMANSSVALTFLLGYEIYGKDIYLEYAKKTMNGVLSPIEKGGSSIAINDSCNWYFEYANEETTLENGGFVLNGFLYALLAINIFEKITGDELYKLAYDKGVASLQLLNEKFYYKNKDWTYYMLNPPVIESTHYCIYDLMLFHSLNKVDNNPYFIEQVNLRRNILKKNYPYEIINKSNISEFLFSVIGPPNPYWIDTYTIDIEFLSNNKIVQRISIEKVRDLSIPVLERAFYKGDIDLSTIDKIKVYSRLYKDKFFLFDFVPSTDINIADINHTIMDYSIFCYRDAKVYDSHTANMLLEGDKKGYRGTIAMKLKKSINIKESKFFGITINPEKDISSILVTIIDTTGHAAHRYYIPINKDKDNLILLNWAGFRKMDNLLSNFIKEVRVDLYYKGVPEQEDPFKVTLSNLYLFPSNTSLFNFFTNNSNVYFPEKKIKKRF